MQIKMLLDWHWDSHLRWRCESSTPADEIKFLQAMTLASNYWTNSWCTPTKDSLPMWIRSNLSRKTKLVRFFRHFSSRNNKKSSWGRRSLFRSVSGYQLVRHCGVWQMYTKVVQGIGIGTFSKFQLVQGCSLNKVFIWTFSANIFKNVQHVTLNYSFFKKNWCHKP